MATVWETRDRGPGLIKEALLTLVVSSLVVTSLVLVGYNLYTTRSQPDRQTVTTHELRLIKSALTALERRQHKAALATASCHRDLTMLTAENGILERLIARVQAIRQANAALSERLRAVEASAAALDAGRALSADGQAAAISPSRRQGTPQLTVVTPPERRDLAQPFRQTARPADAATVKPGKTTPVQGG